MMLERYVLPFVWGDFAIAAFAGTWLFIFEARTLADDPPFSLKMGLIPVAGLNALFMHEVRMRDAKTWDMALLPPVIVRVSAGLSILVWLTVLACGRLIAY